MGSERRRLGGATLAAVLAGIVILGGGFVIGRLISAEPPAGLVEPGTLIELRMLNGTALVGVYTGSGDGFAILSTPAEVTISDGSGQTVTIVQALASPPHGLAGDVLVRQDQVVLIGAVAPASELESRYYEAVGAAPRESIPQPSP